MDEHSNIEVSICVVTYNQEKYIEACILGILGQKTNFNFEIIIGEDGSSDKTTFICKRYASLYPNRIKLFLRDRKDVIFINGKPTGKFNFIETIQAAKGKFIALCEGDDYWTDPEKLQKQYNFLENNPKYGLCGHNVIRKNEFENNKDIVLPNFKVDKDISIEDFILNNALATCSLFFRKNDFIPIPKFFSKIAFGDLALILIVLTNTNKKAKCLKNCMGVYRLHSGGVHGNLQKNNNLLSVAYFQHIDNLNLLDKNLGLSKVYNNTIVKKKLNIYNSIYQLTPKKNIIKKIILKFYVLFYTWKIKKQS